jgi:hypothetical protein
LIGAVPVWRGEGKSVTLRPPYERSGELPVSRRIWRWRGAGQPHDGCRKYGDNNKGLTVHSLIQFWRNTTARIAKAFMAAPRGTSVSQLLERELATVTRNNQSSAGEIPPLHAGSEQALSPETQEILPLEDARQDAASARTTEAGQLSGLERRIVELEADRDRAFLAVTTIESTLNTATKRLAALDGQLGNWQARIDDQAKSLAAALAHQEATTGELAILRDESQQRARTFESSLADASRRFVAADEQTRMWQARADEQAKVFEMTLSGTIERQAAGTVEFETLRDASRQQFKSLESSLAGAANHLGTMDGQLRSVEQKLDLEHRLYLHTVQEIQNQVRVQDQRLGWTKMAVVLAMLLGAVGGGILIWEVQKNAVVLTAMNQDLQRVMASMGPLSATLPQFSDRTVPAAGDLEPVSHDAESPTVKGQQEAGRGDARVADEADRVPVTVTAAVESEQRSPLAEIKSTLGKKPVPEPEQAPAASDGENPVNSIFAGSAFQRTREAQVRRQNRPDGLVPYLKNMIDAAGSVGTPAPEMSTAASGKDAERALDMLPNGVGYRVVKSGFGRAPGRGDKVVLNYIKITPDGAVLEETYSSGKPVTLYMKSVDARLQTALLKMPEGAEWEVYVPAAAAPTVAEKSRDSAAAAQQIYLVELLKVVRDRDRGR